VSGCEAALDCRSPATHFVTWHAPDRAKCIARICGGHARVLTDAVHSGNAARHGHTPVVVSGPYTPDGLDRQVAFTRRIYAIGDQP
jgi:hypothetical protein